VEQQHEKANAKGKASSPSANQQRCTSYQHFVDDDWQYYNRNKGSWSSLEGDPTNASSAILRRHQKREEQQHAKRNTTTQHPNDMHDINSAGSPNNWAGVYNYFCSFHTEDDDDHDEKDKDHDLSDVGATASTQKNICQPKEGEYYFNPHAPQHLVLWNHRDLQRPPSQDFLILPKLSGELEDPESVYGQFASFEGVGDDADGRSVTSGGSASDPYSHFAAEAESDDVFWNRSRTIAAISDVTKNSSNFASCYEDMPTLELIQYASSFVRHYLAILVLQRWWCQVLERRQIAALVLQCWWRTTRRRAPFADVDVEATTSPDVDITIEEEDEVDYNLIGAVVVVQCWWRRVHAGLMLRIDSAVRIQQWWKVHLIRRAHAITLIKTKTHSVCSIQKWWMGISINRTATKSRLQQIIAASKIQQQWRVHAIGNSLRLRARLRAVTLEAAALEIQYWFISTLLSQKERSAITIQRCWRKINRWRNMTAAASKIQQQWRANSNQYRTQQEPVPIEGLQSNGNHNDDNELSMRAEKAQDILEARIQETLQLVESSWALMVSQDRVSSVQRRAFLSLVDDLSRYQDHSICLWKARCQHREKSLAVRVQTWWRMTVAQRNYRHLLLVASILPVRTRDCMLSKVQGPNLWGSQARTCVKRGARLRIHNESC